MSIPAELLREHDITDLVDTERLGHSLATHLEKGDVLALHGDLGAGKTALARSIIIALGHRGEVPSPTFTLVQRYDLPQLVVHHFDLYRLKTPDELEDIGWHDALAEGAAIVEWPDKAGSYLPASTIDLWLSLSGQKRSCTIKKKKA